MGLNQFIQRKTLEAATKVQDYLDTGLGKTTIKQDSKMVLSMTKLAGKSRMRAQVLKGFANKDFPLIVKENPDITAEELLAPYRKEAEFYRVLKKLKIAWWELEEIAKKAVN